MPLIDDRPKLRISIFKITKLYVSKISEFTVDCYSFLSHCNDVKKECEHIEGARLLEISEPVFVGDFITRRKFQFCEYFDRTAIKFSTGMALFAEELLTDKDRGRFYKSHKK
ncbi:MAG: hypothetical protein LBC02_01000 [Planctomycetaceae bacterium]|jgi:hypothetical protein|nr:hypothetical protein [Planctomycetaceae bacterium]